MAKQMIARLHLTYPLPEWSIPPVRSGRLIQYHHRRLMRNDHVCIGRNQTFRMIICQSEESDSFNHASAILQEMYSFGQIFDAFRIPKAQVMVSRYKKFVRIRKSCKPIQKVQHLLFGSVFRKIPTMHNDICCRKFRQFRMMIMRV